MANLNSIVAYLNEYLDTDRFQDYAPNGLQVEGRPEVRFVMGGVTASRALVEAAVREGADALLVHHGYFWRGGDPRVRGIMRERLKLLLSSDISLIAYHLPLDAHPEVGNNRRLGELLEIEITGPLDSGGDLTRGLHGRFPEPLALESARALLARKLGREPLHIAGGDGPIRTIGWCTGAAQGFLELAVDKQLDAYVSGEISEQTVHLARESGTHYFSAGHHATERYGVQALGAHLADKFGLRFRFEEISNPV